MSARLSQFHPFVLVFSVLIVMVLSSCTPRLINYSGESSPLSADTPATLPQGLAYARAARDRIHSAMVGKVKEQTAVTNSLIGIGVLSLGLAASTAHKDAILVATGLGATVYTYGTISDSEKPMLAYKAGIQALNCAGEAMLPFLHGKQLEKSMNSLSMHQVGLAESRSTTIGELAAYKGAGGANQDLINAANTEIDAVEGVLTTARTALQNGEKLQQETIRSGQRLVSATDRIVSHVNEAVADARIGLDALPDIIAGLSRSMDIFGPSFGISDYLSEKTTGRFKSDDESQSDLQLALALLTDDKKKLLRLQIASLEIALNDARADLARKQATLIADTARVLAFVEDTNSEAVKTALAACGVPDIDTSVSVNSNEVKFIVGKEGRKTLLIAGGQKPYRFTWLSTPTPGLNLRPPYSGDNSLDIDASTDTEEGEYIFAVLDSSKNATDSPVSVTIKVSKGDNNEEPDNGGGKKSGLEKLKVLEGKTITLADLGGQGDIVVRIVSVGKKDGKTVVKLEVTDENVSPTFSRESVEDAIGALEDSGKNKIGNFLPDNINFEPEGLVVSAESQSVVRRRLSRYGEVAAGLNPGQVGAFQRLFCMPSDEIDGKWGKKTKEAFGMSGWFDQFSDDRGHLTEQAVEVFLSERTDIKIVCRE